MIIIGKKVSPMGLQEQKSIKTSDFPAYTLKLTLLILILMKKSKFYRNSRQWLKKGFALLSYASLVGSFEVILIYSDGLMIADLRPLLGYRFQLLPSPTTKEIGTVRKIWRKKF